MSKLNRVTEKSKNVCIVALLVYAAFSVPFVLGYLNPPVREVRETIREIQVCPASSGVAALPEPPAPKTVKVKKTQSM